MPSKRATPSEPPTAGSPMRQEPARSGGNGGNGGGSAASGTTEPRPLTAEQLTGIADPPRLSGPALTPAQAAAGLSPATVGAAGDGVAATWRGGQYVTALWSIDEIRNAWINVQGLGWRRLFNGRDGAFNALVTLAAQARQTGRPIAFREEADGMVYEIYLW